MITHDALSIDSCILLETKSWDEYGYYVSIVYPYDMQNYPAHLKIVCDGKTLTDTPAELKRGMIIYNFPNEDSCSNVQLGFSDFQGQKRLLIKDIYFYGK